MNNNNTNNISAHLNPELEREVLGLTLNAARNQGADALPALQRDLLAFPAAIMGVQAHQDIYSTIRAMVEDGRVPTPYEVSQALPNVPKDVFTAVLNAEAAAELEPHLHTLSRLAAARSVTASASAAISRLRAGEDPAAVQVALQDALEAGDAATTRPKHAAELGSVTGYLQALTSGQIPMVSTGFPSLDAVIGGGLEPGSYVLLGMPTNAGKTRMALSIALAQLEAARGVTYVSGEMKSTAGGENATHRLLLALTLMKAGVQPRLIAPNTKISDATLQRIGDAENWLKERPFHVHDRDMSTDTIASIARRMRREGQTLMVIDNLNHVTLPGGERMAGWEQKNIISERLADIAHSTGIVLLTLVQTQINANLERPASLSEISDSKGVARPADLVLTAWRNVGQAVEQARLGNNATQGIFHVAKRRAGVGGDVQVTWREDLAQWVPA